MTTRARFSECVRASSGVVAIFVQQIARADAICAGGAHTACFAFLAGLFVNSRAELSRRSIGTGLNKFDAK